MPGAIAEVYFPEGLKVNPKLPLSDQALLKASEGSHKILSPALYDLTPTVKVSPPLEHLMGVFPGGQAVIRSHYPIKLKEAQETGFFSKFVPDFVQPPFRRVNVETQEQFITGFW